ncbi:MAG: biotin--[acetyl-CoA-carboxylase] ligase [Gulosibacter sp.]|uniref:biotin--[acetyl-CoA-carboxylase] ligase n=1 Tax=Gulosibacter sp. TaxID=2817531 RepID=UPI003F9015B3
MPELIDVPLEGQSVATIEWHDEVDSTNDLMRRRFTDEDEDFAPFASIATGSQTSGRGRFEREWLAPAGTSVAISTYVEFPADAARQSIGWVTLAAGVALRDALVGLAPEVASRVGIKWPNDVQIDGRKVSGILGELLGVVDGGARFACVVGVGVNLATPQGGLPFPNAIALDEVGVSVSPQSLAEAFVRALAARVTELSRTQGNADASGLRDDLVLHCNTIGARVRVTLPDDADLVGIAIGIGADGTLEVRDDLGQAHSVNAGDVEHVRPADNSQEGE